MLVYNLVEITTREQPDSIVVAGTSYCQSYRDGAQSARSFLCFWLRTWLLLITDCQPLCYFWSCTAKSLPTLLLTNVARMKFVVILLFSIACSSSCLLLFSSSSATSSSSHKSFLTWISCSSSSSSS